MEKRDINTFITKSDPIRNTDLEHLQLAARSLIHANPSGDSTRFLWEYNCAIYSVPGRENTTTTKDEFEGFWRPIWENSSENVLQEDGLTKRQDSYGATYRAVQ